MTVSDIPLPFVFSAGSDASLIAQLQAYSSYLKSYRDRIHIHDLIWTLHSRKSHHPIKISLSANSVADLITKIDAKLSAKDAPNAGIGTRSTGDPNAKRVLGVFTGQGAQWAGMGAALIRSSQLVRDRIQHLEAALATLPIAHRPSWSLKDEMIAGSETSRIAEAALSQPLCTALQIVLVDLLSAAGIRFATVVGHSSGEIAACYAAGFISARDAIRIAYYRGFFAYLASNVATNQKGAMLAVGTSWEDAQQLTNTPKFKGRLALAAHNSSASVTLSGDVDAVTEAKQHYDKEKTFARLLKVDTAYHSHHMIPCSEPYVEALNT